MYRNLAVVQQKIYSYLTRFKNVAFHANFFVRTTTKGPPPRCLPQGPHHPKSTPVNTVCQLNTELEPSTHQCRSEHLGE